MRGISVEPIEPWTAQLPTNIKFTVQRGNSHGPAEAFYNPETGELLHIVYNDRNKYNDKWEVLVHDTGIDAVREEKTHRKVIPNVQNEIVRVYSGDRSYAKGVLFEKEVVRDGESPEVRREAEEAMRDYMQS